MSQSVKKINNIPLVDAKNNIEKAIIGIVRQEAERLEYGSISIELKVHNGKLTHLALTQSSKSISLHNIA